MKLLKTCWIRESLENYNNIDLLWFNFIESSKRYITPEKASKIETPFSTLRVWVFWQKDEEWNWWNISKWELVDIILTARKARMNAIQIHWFCDFAYLKMYNFLVFSSINIEEKINLDNEYIDFFIIDWTNPWSWKWYDYKKIKKLNLKKNFLVAGWVNEKNVWEIFKIFKDNKYFCWVDVASWVDNWKNIDLEKVNKIVNLINKKYV
jgi:phosphoribosylanthranilate isomerase